MGVRQVTVFLPMLQSSLRWPLIGGESLEILFLGI